MTNAHHEDAGASEPHVAIQRISHELRTPLTVVIGFCELLTGDRPDDASIKEFAARISTNAWQLHSAVERLIEELRYADYTGPPSDLAFHWMTDPNAIRPASPSSGTTRTTIAPDHRPAAVPSADEPQPVP